MPGPFKAIPLQQLAPEAWDQTAGKAPVSVLALYSSVPWLYRSVEIISQAVASLPKRLISDDGEVEDPVVMVPYYGELADLFNQWAGDYLLYGACYALVTRRRNGIPVSIRRLSPSTIHPKYDTARGLVGFRRIIGGKEQTLTLDDIAYMFAPNRDSEVGPGIAPAVAALKAAGALFAIDSVIEGLFANGAIRPTLAIFKNPMQEPERERVQSLLRRAITGIRNATKLIALSSDVSLQTIGEYPDRLAMPELTDAKRQDICTALGIPSTLLFSDAANYATAHQDVVNFYDLTVIPLAQRMCATINAQVLNRTRYVLRTAEGELELYQQFEASRVNALSSMFDRGIITVNEYRERMGMGPIAAAPAAEGEDEPESEATETEDSEENSPEAAKELRAWGRFAMRRLKLGRPMRPFETRHVPPVLAAAVRADIEAATTADDIKAIIANAIEWLEYP